MAKVVKSSRDEKQKEFDLKRVKDERDKKQGARVAGVVGTVVSGAKLAHEIFKLIKAINDPSYYKFGSKYNNVNPETIKLVSDNVNVNQESIVLARVSYSDAIPKDSYVSESFSNTCESILTYLKDVVNTSAEYDIFTVAKWIMKMSVLTTATGSIKRILALPNTRRGDIANYPQEKYKSLNVAYSDTYDELIANITDIRGQFNALVDRVIAMPSLDIPMFKRKAGLAMSSFADSDIPSPSEYCYAPTIESVVEAPNTFAVVGQGSGTSAAAVPILTHIQLLNNIIDGMYGDKNTRDLMGDIKRAARFDSYFKQSHDYVGHSEIDDALQTVYSPMDLQQFQNTVLDCMNTSRSLITIEEDNSMTLEIMGERPSADGKVGVPQVNGTTVNLLLDHMAYDEVYDQVRNISAFEVTDKASKMSSIYTDNGAEIFHLLETAYTIIGGKGVVFQVQDPSMLFKYPGVLWAKLDWAPAINDTAGTFLYFDTAAAGPIGPKAIANMTYEMNRSLLLPVQVLQHTKVKSAKN